MFFKRLSRTLFSLTPSRSPSPYSFIAQCSTSSLSHPKVSVWWNLDYCTVPPGVNGAQTITAAIESCGIKGPIQITAFGDMVRFARTNPETISSTEIIFTHIPDGVVDGVVDSVNRSLFIDLMLWVSRNPPPAHLFLIVVERGFTSFLNRLGMKNYNILLASKESARAVQRSAANIMWNWDALVRGENLTGRYFKEPASWYGHYEGPLGPAPDDQLGEVLQQKHSKSKTHEVFSQDSFWRDVQTFINTDLGSFIIAESKTREKMAYNLQKYGPSVLKSVTKSDVLLMVDMLISEKKWVLERPYFIRPFELASSAGNTSENSDGTDSDYEFVYSDDDFSDSE